MNRWWHAAGLPDVLATYLTAVRPKAVVDLLSLEYRESVAGYQNRLPGISVQPIDFPGMGRASQPARGEKVAAFLRTGKAQCRPSGAPFQARCTADARLAA